MGTRIQVGTAADTRAAAGIWQAAHASRLGFVPEGARKERAMAVLAARIDLPGAQFIVAEKGSQVFGMILANQAREYDGDGDIIPNLLHVSYVATHPAHWGMGVASELLRSIAERARSSGNDALQLWVVTNNLRARAIYERHGFEFSGREKIDDYGERMRIITGDCNFAKLWVRHNVEATPSGA